MALAIAVLFALPGAGTAEETGKRIFDRACASCHSIAPGDNGIGPSLAGIVGRKAGSAPGYKYSAAAQKSEVIWDEAALDAFLADPRKFMPGTKKLVAGIGDPRERAAIIAYVRQQR